MDVKFRIEIDYPGKGMAYSDGAMDRELVDLILADRAHAPERIAGLMEANLHAACDSLCINVLAKGVSK
jgi:hypothetical protein